MANKQEILKLIRDYFQAQARAEENAYKHAVSIPAYFQAQGLREKLNEIIEKDLKETSKNE
jgi:hypothetical protein